MDAATAPAISFPSVYDNPQDVFWKRLLLRLYGRAQALKVLKIKRCLVCQGRLGPYCEPLQGAAASRATGVPPSLRCRRCGRIA